VTAIAEASVEELIGAAVNHKGNLFGPGAPRASHDVYEQKSNGVVRVYSAREMTEKERRTYRRNTR
jgi:hypothetical protein